MTSTKLLQKIAASAYLGGIQTQYGLNAKLHGAKDVDAKLSDICDAVAAYPLEINSDSDSDVIIDFLRASKAAFAFEWCQAELSEILDLAHLGEWQTRFAEVSINFALKAAWHLEAKKYKAIQKVLQDSSGLMPGLFIFGMGKLGGRDLNFSSDVDLVAYFNPVELPIADTLGKSYICHRVLQTLTALLSQKNNPQFIWRVDWRLRPNASATTLAMSTLAAEDYYFFHASPWHRLALMKARVIAGDIDCGQRFLNLITPFIWRQNLDFRALDELAEIKQRINLEHPSLKVQRTWREPISDELAGFNVKLGSGGIREIEFIANALQLIWGGKHYPLRTSNTVQALTALGELQFLDADMASQLQIAYRFFRHLENCIQILNNQQTQLVPVDRLTQENLLVLLGVTSFESLTDQANVHRRIVNKQFEQLFNTDQETSVELAQWSDQLVPAAQEIVDAWQQGFQNYGVPLSMQDKLRPFLLNLSKQVASNREDKHSDIIMRLHDFFRSLPQGGQYFRMLAESPWLVDSIIPPLLYSPPMTALLKQSPHIIDCYMQSTWNYQQDDFDSEYIFLAERYEIRLERTRRFVNEHLYQLYLQFINGQIDVEVFQRGLSDLATHTLECCLRLVVEHMEIDASPISILGMGKLGMGRMSPLSDLDLIFVFDQDKTPIDLASRFVSRLQTAITSPMQEGIVYELDTRLRPSGRSGAPTVGIESLRKHHLNQSHTWEHIALVAAKVVAGDRSMVEPVMQVKHQILTRPRNVEQFYRDAIKMWHRIEQHRIQKMDSQKMFSKLREGGLMQSEYLASVLIIANAAQFNADDNKDYDAMLRHASSATAISDLSEIIQFWRIQQLWERLLGMSEQALSAMPDAYLQRLLEHSAVETTQQLISKKTDYANRVAKAMNDLFKDYHMNESEIDSWHETAVQWERQ